MLGECFEYLLSSRREFSSRPDYHCQPVGGNGLQAEQALANTFELRASGTAIGGRGNGLHRLP